MKSKFMNENNDMIKRELENLEKIKSRQSEVEAEIRELLAELSPYVKDSIGQMRRYQVMWKNQLNPKDFTEIVGITVPYLQKINQLLPLKIKEQATLAIEATTLGHHLTSRERAYINYFNLLSSDKLDDLYLTYMIFCAEFSTKDFGSYAKFILDEMNQAKKQKLKRDKLKRRLL